MAVRATKRRRLSPAEEQKPKKAARPAKPDAAEKDLEQGLFAQATEWDGEQTYEQQPRVSKTNGKRSKLPIKTADGWVEQTPDPEPEPEEQEESDTFIGSGDEAAEAQQQEEEPKISQRQRIIQAKEELAKLAGQLHEDPETNIGALKVLEEFAGSQHVAVKKITLATQLAVYKDIIPGYRIRPISGEELSSTAVSKEVRKLRGFEQSLLTGYKNYIHALGNITKRGMGPQSEEAATLTTVAYSCVCNLLTSVSHFNFRSELMQIIVRKVGTKEVDSDFRKCIESFELLFRNDEEGHASLDAVKAIHAMIKAKHYRPHESVLNTFLHLRLLSELGVKGSHEKIDKPEEKKNGKTKWKKEWRSKREKKLARENKAIEKEFKEADAAVSHEERDKNQSETLKIVFVTYFQILKKRSKKLMGAVLEGLAKYSHLINQDFFGDILEVLKELMTSVDAADPDDDEDDDNEDTPSNRRDVTRSSLLCCVTAFALLQGQDSSYATSALHLDLSFFYTNLYRTLLPVSLNPDIELNSRSLRLPDPHYPEASQPQNDVARTKVNVQTTTVLLIRSLTSVLLPAQALRSIPPVRIAAFTKQLLMAALQLPEKSCIAMLGLLNMVAKAHGKKIAALWRTEERKGDGVFDPLNPLLEASNPFAGTVWEGEVLRRHFCPTVREAIVGVEKAVLEAAK